MLEFLVSVCQYSPQKHVTQPYLNNFEFNQFEIQKSESWIKIQSYLYLWLLLHVFEGNRRYYTALALALVLRVVTQRTNTHPMLMHVCSYAIHHCVDNLLCVGVARRSGQSCIVAFNGMTSFIVNGLSDDVIHCEWFER